MKRTNRIEPVNAGSDVNDLTRATVTTTTHMEFVRRVQVVPMVSESEQSIYIKYGIKLLRVNEDLLFFSLLFSIIDHGKRTIN